MNESPLRKILTGLDIQVVHKNNRGWLVAKLASCRYVRLVLQSFMQHYRIPGYPEYEVTRDGGSVRRIVKGHGVPAGKVLKQFSNSGRYKRVKTAHGAVMVHRLVCLAIHGLPPEGRNLVLHKNDIPTDNRAENLYWGNARENLLDAARNGSIGGERHGRAVLTRKQALQIRGLRGCMSERRLAKYFGVSRSTVWQILNNQIWKE